jgi:hypothetical protein
VSAAQLHIEDSLYNDARPLRGTMSFPAAGGPM